MARNISKIKPREVLIVDGHPLEREGLAQIINAEADLRVCGEADTYTEAFGRITSTKPDLVILDLSLRCCRSIELISDMHSRCPRIPILVVSVHDECWCCERVIRAGARGYISKRETTKKILLAVRKVLMNEVYLCEDMALALVERTLLGRRNHDHAPIEQLSNRELQVLGFIGGGVHNASNRQATEPQCAHHRDLPQARQREAQFAERCRIDPVRHSLH